MFTVLKQKYKFLIIVSVFLGMLLVGIAFWLVNAFDTGAAGGPPAHGRYGSAYHCCGPGNGCSAVSCHSGDITHIQQDLNYLHDNLRRYRIPGGKIAINGTVYEGDAYNQHTEDGVRALQQWYRENMNDTVLVTGNYFNQTATYTEHLVLSAQYSYALGRHTAGQAIRYPLEFSGGDCLLVSNTGGTDFLTPFLARAEWDNFKSNAPNKSMSWVDCGPTPTSGGSSGGDTGGGSTGGGTSGCSNVCQDYDAGCPASCFYCSGTPSYNPDCAPYGSLCIC